MNLQCMHEKNPGPKEDVGHIATMPLVLRKMYQVRDVYSRGITYMMICNAIYVFYIITFLNVVSYTHEL